MAKDRKSEDQKANIAKIKAKKNARLKKKKKINAAKRLAHKGRLK